MTESDILHGTHRVFLKHIYQAFKTGKKVWWRPKGGLPELFVPRKDGVYFGFPDKAGRLQAPHKCPNRLCEMIPKSIRERKEFNVRMSGIKSQKRVKTAYYKTGEQPPGRYNG